MDKVEKEVQPQAEYQENKVKFVLAWELRYLILLAQGKFEEAAEMKRQLEAGGGTLIH